MQSIVEPNAQVVEGFTAGIMPQDFGERASEDDIENLIAFIISLDIVEEGGD